MAIDKALAVGIFAEWTDEIRAMPRSGVVDYSTLIPWEEFTLQSRLAGNCPQALTGLFLRRRYNSRGELISPIDWESVHDKGEKVIAETWHRKEVKGLLRHKGWAFSQRAVTNGIEVRPGIGFILAVSGKVPTCRIVARITRQGSVNDFDKVEVWDKDWKGIKVI